MKPRSHKRTLVGTVVADKVAKTVTVMVTRRYRHPFYKKRVMSHKKYLAHDEQDIYKVGDRVRIRECAPISARKRWLVVEKIERGGES